MQEGYGAARTCCLPLDAILPPTNRPEEIDAQELRKLAASIRREGLLAPLTVEEISSACGMSISGLKRLMNEQCGQPPMAYVTALRLGEARRMIRETTLNFTQIADALGFGSVHYFSRVFKDKVGMTPSEYAKSVMQR